MKIVFFGSSEFAIPALKAITEGGFAPVLVVTKPDAPRGRGRKIHEAEVKLAAQELKLPCEQPADPCAPEFADTLKKLGAEVFVVVSYGKVFPEEFLALPKRFPLNVHASLLPRHRGASPIQHAILSGDKETGITIMRMAKELDAGDILLMEKTPIGPGENADQLRERLAEMGGQVLIKALQLVKSKKEKFQKQDDKKATWCKKIEKIHGVIDWKKKAVDIEMFVRGMTPAPGAQTRLGARRFIVTEGVVETDGYGLGIPGGILSAGEEGVRVCTGDGIYRVLRIKPENGRNMTAGEWVRGHHLAPDARFG